MPGVDYVNTTPGSSMKMFNLYILKEIRRISFLNFGLDSSPGANIRKKYHLTCTIFLNISYSWCKKSNIHFVNLEVV